MVSVLIIAELAMGCRWSRNLQPNFCPGRNLNPESQSVIQHANHWAIEHPDACPSSRQANKDLNECHVPSWSLTFSGSMLNPKAVACCMLSNDHSAFCFRQIYTKLLIGLILVMFLICNFYIRPVSDAQDIYWKKQS